MVDGANGTRIDIVPPSSPILILLVITPLFFIFCVVLRTDVLDPNNSYSTLSTYP